VSGKGKTIMCPSGMSAIGGGGVCTPGDILSSSGPTSDGRGWRIGCDAPSYSNNYGHRDESTVYAICLYTSYMETKAHY
jgi:hypothetical protein